jgi:hypothetical protein
MNQRHPLEPDPRLTNSNGIDEEWFLEGDRSSSVPPRSTRRPIQASTPPPPAAEPIGDAEADGWFR